MAALNKLILHLLANHVHLSLLSEFIFCCFLKNIFEIKLLFLESPYAPFFDDFSNRKPHILIFLYEHEAHNYWHKFTQYTKTDEQGRKSQITKRSGGAVKLP